MGIFKKIRKNIPIGRKKRSHHSGGGGKTTTPLYLLENKSGRIWISNRKPLAFERPVRGKQTLVVKQISTPLASARQGRTLAKVYRSSKVPVVTLPQETFDKQLVSTYPRGLVGGKWFTVYQEFPIDVPLRHAIPPRVADKYGWRSGRKWFYADYPYAKYVEKTVEQLKRSPYAVERGFVEQVEREWSEVQQEMAEAARRDRDMLKQQNLWIKNLSELTGRKEADLQNNQHLMSLIVKARGGKPLTTADWNSFKKAYEDFMSAQVVPTQKRGGKIPARDEAKLRTLFNRMNAYSAKVRGRGKR